MARRRNRKSNSDSSGESTRAQGGLRNENNLIRRSTPRRDYTMADLSSDLIEARGFFAEDPKYDDSRDYSTTRRNPPEAEKPARAAQTLISRGRDAARVIVRPDQINRDVDRAVNQRYQQVKRAFSPILAVRPKTIKKQIKTTIKKAMPTVLQRLADRSATRAKRVKMVVLSPIHSPVKTTLKLLTGAVKTATARKSKPLSQPHTLRPETRDDVHPKDSPTVRASSRHSGCKPRPEDNKKRGHGGSSREYIPWCDRKEGKR